jgi:O-antigen ligase
MASAPTDIGFRESRLGWTLRDRWEAFSFPPWSRRAAAVAGLLVFGAVWGTAVAVAEVPAFFICLSLIACVFCVRDFRAGVAMLIMMIPVAQSHVFPRSMFGITGLNPMNLLLATTVLSYVMRRAGEKRTAPVFPWQLGLLYLLPFTVAAMIGTQHVDEIPSAFRDMDLIFFDNWIGYLRDLWARPLIFVAYALLVAAAVARTDRAERFLTPMVISVFIMAALAVVFVAISDVSLAEMAGTYARDILSPLGMHANDLGRVYATAYALLLFVWDRTHDWTLKTVCLCAMGAVVLALLLTFSRGAFFGFAVVNLIYLFSRRRLKTLLLAIVVGGAGLALMPGAVWYRVTMGLAQGNMNQITAGRTGDIWTPLLPELANHPFLGNGVGSVMYSRAMIEGRLWQVAHPHNAFLEAYMNMGAIGSILVLAFWIWMWRSFRREARNAAVKPEMGGLFEGAAAGLAAYLVAGMAGGSLQPDATHVFLWLAFGMLLGVKAKRAAAAIAAKKGKGKK